MFNLPPDASLLDKACQLYECAFNWVVCGKFAASTADVIGEGLGRWFC